MCFFACACVISNQSTSKKSYYVSGLCKLDALLHKTHIKALLVVNMANMCRSISPIQSKKQDNIKNSGGGVGVDRELKRGCGLNKTSKRWGRQHMGCLHKIGGWHPFANYVKRL